MQKVSTAVRPVVYAGIAIALIWPVLLLVAPPSRLFPDLSLVTRLLLGEALQWALAAVLLCMVVFGERKPLSSLGLGKVRWSGLAWGLATGVLILIALPLVQVLLKAAGVEVSKMQGLDMAELPLWLVLALALRAGVVEEIVFRGFLLERFASVSGRVWIGALLSLAFFVVVHLKTWSVGHLVFVAVAGGLLTGLYVWRRDLYANMAAHVFTDVIALTAAHMQAAG